MKEKVLSILIIMSLLAMISFVVAGICEGRLDGQGNPIHGVEIGGECFDCNSTFSDGICPDDFGEGPGSICIEEWDIDCPPSEKRGLWRESPFGLPISDNEESPFLIDLYNEDILYLILENTDLENGENVTFDIWEYDSILEDPPFGYDDNLSSVIGTVIDGTAIAEFPISSMDNLNEKTNGDYSDENEEGEIQVLYFEAEGITSEYLFANASIIEVGPSGKDCGIYNTLGECSDDAQDQDGVENYRSPNEYCTYLSYTICTWEENNCLSVLGPETLFEGDNETCVEGRTTKCSYNSGDPIGDCESGDDFFKATYIPLIASSECVAWTSGPIPCPQQLKVPFFGFYGFIISLLVIGLIYLFLIKRQEI